MKNIMWSGIILLIAVILFVLDIVLAVKTPIMWLTVVGEALVAYGIYVWHMGIIHSFKQKN